MRERRGRESWDSQGSSAMLSLRFAVIASAFSFAVYGARTALRVQPLTFDGFVQRCVAELPAAYTGEWALLPLAVGAFGGLYAALRVAELVEGWLRPGRSDPGQLAQAGVTATLAEARERISTALAAEEPDIIAVVRETLRAALTVQASDIHVSPTPTHVMVTVRVHGTLYELLTLEPRFLPMITMRVKVLARLDTSLRGQPQDGRLVTNLDGIPVEARVSTLPTDGGERIVLRLVRGTRRVPELEALGFSEVVQSGLVDVLSRPQGLLLVTGPVGSGKTTTLYSCLEHVVRSRGRTTSVVTLEDPIELELPFATQTQVHVKSGMTFATALRSVLRQDPNVLMLGEIRDRETAEVALQAGLTGHLLVTTVHGDGSAGAFSRLLGMDVEPFQLASATVGSLAQRLVRTLCTNCRKPAEPEPIHVERFARFGLTLGAGTFYEPGACAYCDGTGFSGRAALAELLVVGPELRALLDQRPTTQQVAELGLVHGMVPLVEDGLHRARRGETSLTEVLRVAG